MFLAISVSDDETGGCEDGVWTISGLAPDGVDAVAVDGA